MSDKPSDDKPKPLEDLKQGLGLLLRAAKGAVETVAEKVPTEKIEEAASDAVKEVGRALETVGTEIEKAIGSVTGSGQPSPPADPPPQAAAPPPPPPPAPQEPYDDAYAPEPHDPRGPRVG